jgi:GNAT superfamily N-acetyltransferase
MTNLQNLVIERLNSAHDRADFCCGVELLDRYFKKQSNQDVKRRISRVFVATLPDDPEEVVGYYTLSSLSLELHHLPEKLARKLPHHPVPAALIGRLAVSGSVQGHGIGTMLLADAVKRTLSIGDQIAIYALVADAINDDVIRFYRQFGFKRISNSSRSLFLPLKSISP